MMPFALPILMLQAAAPPPRQAPKEERCYVKETQNGVAVHVYILRGFRPASRNSRPVGEPVRGLILP
ncbi:hypothetical protein FHS96_002302 [Sphingomonas zeicaulis]